MGKDFKSVVEDARQALRADLLPPFNCGPAPLARGLARAKKAGSVFKPIVLAATVERDIRELRRQRLDPGAAVRHARMVECCDLKRQMRAAKLRGA